MQCCKNGHCQTHPSEEPRSPRTKFRSRARKAIPPTLHQRQHPHLERSPYLPPPHSPSHRTRPHRRPPWQARQHQPQAPLQLSPCFAHLLWDHVRSPHWARLPFLLRQQLPLSLSSLPAFFFVMSCPRPRRLRFYRRCCQRCLSPLLNYPPHCIYSHCYLLSLQHLPSLLLLLWSLILFLSHFLTSLLALSASEKVGARGAWWLEKQSRS
mmetsp:Transcript_38771/g.71141  ORF Transcript_38771/g.71141 Transcript_38771/m.71141 type:complete len:210 (-) Transcript_38771:124-753(-)